METVNWKEYVDRRLQDLLERLDCQIESVEKSTNARFSAFEKGTDAFERALGIRLETMNQFRTQILEERGEFARKDDLQGVKDIVTENRGRDAVLIWLGSALMAAIFSIVTALIVKGL